DHEPQHATLPVQEQKPCIKVKWAAHAHCFTLDDETFERALFSSAYRGATARGTDRALAHPLSPAPRRMTPVSAERGRRERRSSFVVREAAIVAEATTAGGFRTVRVGKRNSALNAAGNRAAALGWIGLGGIGSRWAVAAIELRIRRLHRNGHGQNAHACDADQRALHLQLRDRHLGFDRVGNETILVGGMVHLVELIRAGRAISTPANLRAKLDTRDGLALGVFLHVANRLVFVRIEHELLLARDRASGSTSGRVRPRTPPSQFGSMAASQTRNASHSCDTLGSGMIVSVGRPCSSSPITSNIRGARAGAGAIIVVSHAVRVAEPPAL